MLPELAPKLKRATKARAASQSHGSALATCAEIWQPPYPAELPPFTPWAGAAASCPGAQAPGTGENN